MIVKPLLEISVPDSTSTYESSFEHCSVGLAHVSPDGDFIRVNKSLCEFLGYTADELTSLTFQALTHQNDLKTDMAFVNSLLEGRRSTYSMEKQYIHKSGDTKWAKLSVSLVRDSSGEPDFFISVVEDIDDKKRIEHRLHESEKLFREVVSSLSDRMLVWVAEPGMRAMRYVNGGYNEIFGRSASELFADPRYFLHYVHHDDMLRVSEVYTNPAIHDWSLQYRILHKDGEVRYVSDNGVTVYDRDGEILFIIGTAADVTRDKNQQQALLTANQELERLTRFDTLTSIYNRREIMRQINAEVRRLERTNHQSTLAFLDLDNFKAINDNYGHRFGDKALTSFADQISQLLRATDRFGRYGGDEFVILLTDTDIEEAENFCDRVREQEITIQMDGKNVKLGFSCGLVAWHQDITSAQQWIEQTDKCMYVEKREHHGRHSA